MDGWAQIKPPQMPYGIVSEATSTSSSKVYSAAKMTSEIKPEESLAGVTAKRPSVHDEYVSSSTDWNSTSRIDLTNDGVKYSLISKTYPQPANVVILSSDDEETEQAGSMKPVIPGDVPSSNQNISSLHLSRSRSEVPLTGSTVERSAGQDEHNENLNHCSMKTDKEQVTFKILNIESDEEDEGKMQESVGETDDDVEIVMEEFLEKQKSDSALMSSMGQSCQATELSKKQPAVGSIDLYNPVGLLHVQSIPEGSLRIPAATSTGFTHLNPGDEPALGNVASAKDRTVASVHKTRTPVTNHGGVVVPASTASSQIGLMEGSIPNEIPANVPQVTPVGIFKAGQRLEVPLSVGMQVSECSYQKGLASADTLPFVGHENHVGVSIAKGGLGCGQTQSAVSTNQGGLRPGGTLPSVSMCHEGLGSLRAQSSVSTNQGGPVPGGMHPTIVTPVVNLVDEGTQPDGLGTQGPVIAGLQPSVSTYQRVMSGGLSAPLGGPSSHGDGLGTQGPVIAGLQPGVSTYQRVMSGGLSAPLGGPSPQREGLGTQGPVIAGLQPGVSTYQRVVSGGLSAPLGGPSPQREGLGTQGPVIAGLQPGVSTYQRVVSGGLSAPLRGPSPQGLMLLSLQPNATTIPGSLGSGATQPSMTTLSENKAPSVNTLAGNQMSGAIYPSMKPLPGNKVSGVSRPSTTTLPGTTLQASMSNPSKSLVPVPVSAPYHTSLASVVQSGSIPAPRVTSAQNSASMTTTQSDWWQNCYKQAQDDTGRGTSGIVETQKSTAGHSREHCLSRDRNPKWAGDVIDLNSDTESGDSSAECQSEDQATITTETTYSALRQRLEPHRKNAPMDHQHRQLYHVKENLKDKLAALVANNKVSIQNPVNQISENLQEQLEKNPANETLKDKLVKLIASKTDLKNQNAGLETQSDTKPSSQAAKIRSASSSTETCADSETSLGDCQTLVKQESDHSGSKAIVVPGHVVPKYGSEQTPSGREKQFDGNRNFTPNDIMEDEISKSVLYPPSMAIEEIVQRVKQESANVVVIITAMGAKVSILKTREQESRKNSQGEKAYQCPNCSFNTPSHILGNLHCCEKSKEARALYHCSFCEVTFFSEIGIIRHCKSQGHTSNAGRTVTRQNPATVIHEGLQSQKDSKLYQKDHYPLSHSLEEIVYAIRTRPPTPDICKPDEFVQVALEVAHSGIYIERHIVPLSKKLNLFEKCMKKRNRGNNLICPKCDFVCDVRRLLAQHLMSTHQLVSPWVYCCSLCKLVTVYHQMFKNHCLSKAHKHYMKKAQKRLMHTTSKGTDKQGNEGYVEEGAKDMPNCDQESQGTTSSLSAVEESVKVEEEVYKADDDKNDLEGHGGALSIKISEVASLAEGTPREVCDEPETDAEKGYDSASEFSDGASELSNEEVDVESVPKKNKCLPPEYVPASSPTKAPVEVAPEPQFGPVKIEPVDIEISYDDSALRHQQVDQTEEPMFTDDDDNDEGGDVDDDGGSDSGDEQGNADVLSSSRNFRRVLMCESSMAQQRAEYHGDEPADGEIMGMNDTFTPTYVNILPMAADNSTKKRQKEKKSKSLRSCWSKKRTSSKSRKKETSRSKKNRSSESTEKESKKSCANKKRPKRPKSVEFQTDSSNKQTSQNSKRSFHGSTNEEIPPRKRQKLNDRKNLRSGRARGNKSRQTTPVKTRNKISPKAGSAKKDGKRSVRSEENKSRFTTVESKESTGQSSKATASKTKLSTQNGTGLYWKQSIGNVTAILPQDVSLKDLIIPIVKGALCNTANISQPRQNHDSKKVQEGPPSPDTLEVPSSPIELPDSSDSEEIISLDSCSSEDLYAELLRRKVLFSCMCGISFQDKSMYFIHMSCHNSANLLKCSFCQYTARNTVDFHSHFYNH